MSDYNCKECGASADVVDNNVARSCACDAPVIASMSATVSADGNLSEHDKKKSLLMILASVLGKHG